ncbi:hypothetical protein [Mesorhizobium sp. L48C026A00]|uniref:hypothetical protein n=1 Tax=Mesorhizobium sp. L48C026A00 TaxID=1287182 RepID=UPI0012EB893D|nr:hypothetical protein [Mesorhizobium sp. L48C026A00]
MLAESYLQHGSADEGLVAIAKAKELSARAEEHMWEAELNRIKGELRRIQGLPAPKSRLSLWQPSKLHGTRMPNHSSCALHSASQSCGAT